MGSTDRKKAFSYVRISSGTQARGGGIRRQLQESRKYAERLGFDLQEQNQLADVGISAFKGKNLAPRAALGRFLEAVKSRKVPPGSVLLVESLDRLSRGEALKAVGTFLDVLNAGIDIHTLADGKIYTSETTFEELMFSIAVMTRAYDESKMKSTRLRAAWRQKRELAGTKPMTKWCPAWLRLSSDRARYEVIEDRARVIRHIFSEALSGVGSYSIARRLNERREPHFGRSRGWHFSLVSKVLKNPAVYGLFQPHKVVDGRRRPDGDPIQQYFPAIVEESVFNRVQMGLGERLKRGRGRKGPRVTNLFPRSMLVCTYCRSAMLYESKERSTLICSAGLRNVGCGSRARWRYSSLEASVLAFCNEINVEAVVRDASDAGRSEGLETVIDELKGELTVIKAKMERVFELLDEGGATAFISEKLRELEERQMVVEADLREKEAELAASTSAGPAHEGGEHLKSLIEKLQGVGDAGDDVFRLRSAISSRLRSLVRVILVAAEGHAPLIKKTIAFLRDQPDAQDVIQHLEQKLQREEEHRCYFSVGFKNGTTRAVFPDKDDPTRVHVQVTSSPDEGLVLRYPDHDAQVFLPRFVASDLGPGEQE
jgi:DNA invertase Pin-like site-specific DNA recombinase